MQGQISYDDALKKHVGQFGPGQRRSLLWASLPQIANAAAFLLFVFCTVDPIANHNWKCTNPADTACAVVYQQPSPSSQSFCSLQPGQWQWTSQDSLVAKFNLICGDAWKVQFANSLTFMGAFLGSGLFGFLCDRWGRRLPLFLATALVAASIFASLAAPSFWVIAALRAVTGIGAAGQGHAIFLLCTEPIGPDYRGFAANASLLFFTVGEFLIVGLGYALPAWQHLTLAIACVNAAMLLLYPLVSESARWLLSQGRTEEATALLQKLAATNKSSLPPQPLVGSSSSQTLQQDEAAAAEEGLCNKDAAVDGQQGDAPLGLWQLVKDRRMAVRLALLLLNWFSLFQSYYGISMGSGGIPGSLYITFTIGTVAEVVALLLVGPTVDRIGRHNIVAVGQLLGGGACLACALVDGGTTQAALAGIGKFGCSAAAAVIGIYTAELLPTSCRSVVMGICSQASRLGALSAPFLLMLGSQLGSMNGHSQVFVPFLVFGCLAVLGGLLTLLMPETATAGMPETMSDLANLLSGFTAKPWRQGFASTVAFLFRTKAAEAYASSSSAPTACGDAGSTDVPAGGNKAGVMSCAVAALVVAEVVGGMQAKQAAVGSDGTAAAEVAIKVCDGSDGSDEISVQEGSSSSGCSSTGSVHSSTH